MKDKNILSAWTSNPFLYIIYTWHSSHIVLIWSSSMFNAFH